jgi:hypothetical protein
MHHQNCCSRSRGGPHLVVLQKDRVNEHAQSSAVTNRKNVTLGQVNTSGITNGTHLTIEYSADE